MGLIQEEDIVLLEDLEATKKHFKEDVIWK